MKNIFFLLCLLLGTLQLTAQTELELITSTVTDYIEGTANGNQDRIRNAFHEDLNLYAIDGENKLITRSGQKYIAAIEEGKKYNRIGHIVSIDYENNAAVAKVSILMPDIKRMYTDYLLLLKVEGQWKVIHKSYTFVDYPK